DDRLARLVRRHEEASPFVISDHAGKHDGATSPAVGRRQLPEDRRDPARLLVAAEDLAHPLKMIDALHAPDPEKVSERAALSMLGERDRDPVLQPRLIAVDIPERGAEDGGRFLRVEDPRPLAHAASPGLIASSSASSARAASSGTSSGPSTGNLRQTVYIFRINVSPQ